MTARRVHGLDVVHVGDLALSVAPPTDRKTLEISIERDATLVLKAPRTATVERTERFVASKRSWIYRKLAEKDALVGPPVVKQFVDSEGFAYLGRSHRILIDTGVDEVQLQLGRFVVPPSVTSDGAWLMREWYVRTERCGSGVGSVHGSLAWVPARSTSPCAILAIAGSARPTDGDQQVNIHWATLQLPPNLIDYIC